MVLFNNTFDLEKKKKSYSFTSSSIMSRKILNTYYGYFFANYILWLFNYLKRNSFSFPLFCKLK